MAHGGKDEILDVTFIGQMNGLEWKMAHGRVQPSATAGCFTRLISLSIQPRNEFSSSATTIYSAK
jgi:hypothetical protein